MTRRVKLTDFETVASNGPSEPPRSVWYESAADLLREPAPAPTPMLVEDLIVDGAVAALVGAAKARKTWASIELGMAVVAGERAFGRFVVYQPGPLDRTRAALDVFLASAEEAVESGS